MTTQSQQRLSRPWWQWLLGIVVVLVIIGELFGDKRSSKPADGARTTTTIVSAPHGAAASSTMRDAQHDIASDDYGQQPGSPSNSTTATRSTA